MNDATQTGTLSALAKVNVCAQSGLQSRGLTATELYPQELAAAILKASRTRRSDRISIDAVEIGTGPHVCEYRCHARWETWGNDDDADGNLNECNDPNALEVVRLF